MTTTAQQRSVVVVGGGMIGCAVAAALRVRGHEVTLCEGATTGGEASFAAAGILGPQLEHDEDGPAVDLGLAGRAATLAWVRAIREETGVDIELGAPGALVKAMDDDDARALERRVTWQRARGLRAEWRADAREAFFVDDTTVDTRAYAHGLAALARRRGARVLTGVPVTGLLRDADGVRGVTLADGDELRADHVVVCAGAWSTTVPGVAEAASLPKGAVFPVRGQIVELVGPPGLVPTMVYGGKGYVVPRRDGRLICGSTMEKVGFDKSVTAGGVKMVLEKAITLVPAVAELRVNATWAGLRPATLDGLPLIGATRTPGLLLATGHLRNGVLLAAITGELMGAILDGERPELARVGDPARLAR
ncbi:MAG: FAD-dependent oxidoreductase [Deltaproteobacteria bacterium]|nr:FAD-dependent oxidoreductase [Deltaproteobacteria bacterium]